MRREILGGSAPPPPRPLAPSCLPSPTRCSWRCALPSVGSWPFQSSSRALPEEGARFLERLLCAWDLCRSHPTSPTACGLWPWLICPHCPPGGPLALLLLDEDHPPGGGQPGPCAPLSLLLSGSGHTPQLLSAAVYLGASPYPPALPAVKGCPLGDAALGFLWHSALPPASFRNAVYSTPRDFASPVSRTTWMLSLRKSSKTWRKGKSPPRGLPANAVLDHECSRVPGPQRCPPGARAHAGFHGPCQRRGRDGATVPAFFLGHWEPCLQPGGAGVCLQQHQGQELAETAPIARPQMPALRDRSRPPSQPPA